jgi:hypothetical protein
MALIHYDAPVADTCWAEAMAGGLYVTDPFDNGTTAQAGQLPPAGMMMGRNRPLYSSGCHYISLGIFPTLSGGEGYRFFANYLQAPPLVLPLGTEKSIMDCVWRSIPYRSYRVSGTDPLQGALVGTVSGTVFADMSSSGAVLWDRRPDRL